MYVGVSGDDSNKPKMHSRGNQEQTKFTECFLLWRSKPSSLPLSKNVTMKIKFNPVMKLGLSQDRVPGGHLNPREWT
jgi:hypothetical protein